MFAVGSLVKLNEVIQNAANHDMVADLGYVGLLKHFTYRVEKTETDQYRGEIAHCSIVNPNILVGIDGIEEVEIEGHIILLLKDLVRASMKTTLDYKILEIDDSGAKLAALSEERKRMKDKGIKISSPVMRKNWAEITALKEQIKNTLKKDMVEVVLPRHNIKIEVKKSELPTMKDMDSFDKFKQLLASKLRTIRNERKKPLTEVKDVFGVAVQKVNGVYTEKDSLYNAYIKSLKTAFDTDKKPVDPNANYVGVEIELVFAGNEEKFKELLIKEKLHRNVTLKSDGSLRVETDGGYNTKEVTLIAKSSELKSVLDRLQTVLENPEVDAYVNRSCGLHVHLDMRNRDAAKSYKNLFRVQDILRGSQPVGRIKNTYCKPNTIEDFIPKKPETRHDRYQVINPCAYDKFKTLEIRVHEGTVDCSAIYNWVQFLEAVVNKDGEIPKGSYKKAADLEGIVSLTQDSINYLDKRIAKFKSLSVG